MVFLGSFVVSRGRIWRIARLSVLETLLAVQEGEELEESLREVCGTRSGAGMLCAFAARFLRRGRNPVFANGSMAADMLDLPCLAELCERYRRLYLKEARG